MTSQRTATFGPADDTGAVWLLRCDSSLNWVMARFAPAVLDRGRHAYVIPVEHVEPFRAFAKLHSVELTSAPVLLAQPTYVPGRFVRERRPPEQDATNRSGIARVRKALADHRARLASGSIVRSWEDW